MAKKQPAKVPTPPQRRPAPAAQRAAKPNPKPASATSILSGPWWIGLLAAGLGVILYANTIGHDYTLDDFGAIKENWVVKGGFSKWGLLWSTEYRYGSWASPGSLYRPLSLAMFSIEHMMMPNSPMIGHLFNILYYGLTGLVLWMTWRRVLSDYPWQLAAAAVLLFIAHPVHTEVVANIKSRDEIISLLGSNLALYFVWRHLESDQNKWMIWALVTYGAGLFAKESGITWLAIFPLTLYFFGNVSADRVMRIALLFLIPAGLFLFIRWRVLSAQNYKEVYSILDNFMAEEKNVATRLASAFMMSGYYLKALFFPHPLVSDMGYPQMKVVTFSDWRAWSSLLIYFSMGAFVIYGLIKRHFLAFAMGIYLIAFSLFSNILMLIGTSYGERLLYAPSLGFALGIGWLLTRLFKIKRSDDGPTTNDATPFWVVLGILLAGMAYKTVDRNADWENSFTLYEADILNSPNCAKLNYHRALEQNNHGIDKEKGVIIDRAEVDKALSSYNKAIELYPKYHDAYGSRGLLYFRMQNYDKAYDDYKVALKNRPNDAKVLSNMGFIYFLRAQRPGNQLAAAELDSAEVVYRKSIQFDPRFVDARRNLGAVLAMKKNFPPAIEQWKEGLKYEPNSAILHFYIGSAYRDMGQPELGQPWFEKAYQLDPSLKK